MEELEIAGPKVSTIIIKVFVILADVVRPPVIEDARYDTPTSLAVSFRVPSSEQNADYFGVSYYNHTGSTFQQVQHSAWGSYID